MTQSGSSEWKTQDQVHQSIVNKFQRVQDWFHDKSEGLEFPVYSSFDIRDSGFKASVIDANIFPAGFNNICDVDQENAPELMKSYLAAHYSSELQNLLLLTEEHTSNAYYWENVRALVNIIEEAGKSLRVAVPRSLEAPLTVQTASGHELQVHGAERVAAGVEIGSYRPQLIISNNDFSESHAEWSEGLTLPMNPPRGLGWYQRKKSNYFHQYNQLAAEFAELLGLDPWFFDVMTESFVNEEHSFDLADEQVKGKLASQVDRMIAQIGEKYRQHGIDEEPFVMLKNNSGTYGLGVVQVRSGEDVLAINYKKRKKMKATKGGGGVSEVILQEGVPSALSQGEETTEPAIYMIGRELAGGFLRAHKSKGPKESLNSPGAVYRRLCVTDLKISVEGHPLENTYGWLARLGLLAIGRETAEMKVEYSQYH